MEIHPKQLRLGRLQTKLVFALNSLGKVQRPRLEHATSLARFLLKLLIQPHRIMLNTTDVGAVVQTVDVGGGVPRGARGKFITFNQNNVFPAQFGKVIQDRTSDYSTTDYDCLCMGTHMDTALK